MFANINKLIIKNKFFKNSLLYTIGSMMTPLIGFIMIPIFTASLTPSEYATMTTIQTLVGLLQLFLLLSLHGAITRFYFDFLQHQEKQKEYLGTIFVFVLLFSTILATILFIFKNSIGNLLFKNIPIDPFYLYLIGLSWISSLYSLQISLIRVQEKAVLFVILNFLKEISIMLITIYLIIIKGLGAESALISQFIITFIIVFFTFVVQSKFLKFTFNITFIKQSLIFSIPLLPHVASSWIINSSDKIILEKFVDMNDLGIYALATQVSMVLVLFYSSVNNALVPRYTRLRIEENDLNANKLLRLFLYIIIVFGIFSIPIAMYAIKLVTLNNYHDAILIIPFLLLGKIVMGFYYIPVARLFYEKKTKSIALSSTIAAVSSIIVNLILIPFLGIYGAVISSVISELLRFLFIYKANIKI